MMATGSDAVSCPASHDGLLVKEGGFTSRFCSPRSEAMFFRSGAVAAGPRWTVGARSVLRSETSLRVASWMALSLRGAPTCGIVGGACFS